MSRCDGVTTTRTKIMREETEQVEAFVSGQRLDLFAPVIYSDTLQKSIKTGRIWISMSHRTLPQSSEAIHLERATMGSFS